MGNPVTATVRMARFRADTRGFTLLELIVVMVLIGLVAGFAVPRLGGFLAADQMKTTVRKLIGLIHRTSDLARRYQVPYLLRYDAGERCFIAVPEEEREPSNDASGDQPSFATAVVPVGEAVVVGEFWFWYGGVGKGAERTIRFSKEGYSEPAILYFGGEDGREMSVILSPFLGIVRVVDRYVVPEVGLFGR